MLCDEKIQAFFGQLTDMRRDSNGLGNDVGCGNKRSVVQLRITTRSESGHWKTVCASVAKSLPLQR
jgi:hypothetical protein